VALGSTSERAVHLGSAWSVLGRLIRARSAARTASRHRVVATMAAVVYTLSACVTAVPSPQSREYFFPRFLQTPTVTPLARHEGTLAFEDGCLWLSNADGRDLLVWGVTHSARWWSGRLEILERDRVVAGVGDRIAVTGGELLTSEAPQADSWVESNVGQPFPAACRMGRYWQLGDLRRR
jgi:hypothetical protein